MRDILVSDWLLWSCGCADHSPAILRATTDALLCQMGLVVRALSQQPPDLAPSSALPLPEGVPKSLAPVTPVQQSTAAALALGMLQYA